MVEAQVSGQPLEVANGKKKRGKGNIDLQETDSPPLLRLRSGKFSSRISGAFIFELSLTLILGHDFLSAHFFNALTRHKNYTRTKHIWT